MKEKLAQKDLRSIVISLFTISTLFILPIIFKTDYTDLFITKYVYYYVSALVTIGLFLIIQIVYYARGKLCQVNFQKWEIALFVFLGICIISTLQSDFVYEAFWGNEGRYNGLFLILLYCITTFLVGRHLDMKQKYFDLFLIAGILVVLLGLGDYLDLNILNLKHNMTKGKPGYTTFTSTVGNINFYTSYVALVLGGTAGAFSNEKERWRTVFYYICYVLAFLGLITGNSDSGYLAMAAIIGLLPLYCLKSRISARRYMILLATSVSLIQLIGWINQIWSERVIVLDSLLSKMARTETLIVAVVLWLITAFLYLKKRSSDNGDNLPKQWRYIWVGTLLCLLICVLLILYDVNVAGNVARYPSLEQYLHFDDDWGTKRGYAWRIAWEYYVSFTPLHKVFGYGLETFPILTIYRNKWEMAYVYESFYDSVHNEYLQYLLAIGAAGIFAYITFLVTIILTLINNIKKTPYLLGIVIGLIAYLVQAVVNISTVNVAAVLWMLIAIGMAACRKPKVGTEKMSFGEDVNGEKSN